MSIYDSIPPVQESAVFWGFGVFIALTVSGFIGLFVAWYLKRNPPGVRELSKTVEALSNRVAKLEIRVHNEQRKALWLERVLYLAVDTIEGLNARLVSLGHSPTDLPGPLMDWKRAQGEWSGVENSPASNLVDLHRLMTDTLDAEDLNQLVFELGINHDELGGGRLTRQIRNLLLQLEREGRLGNLVVLLRAKRPAVTWPTFC